MQSSFCVACLIQSLCIAVVNCSFPCWWGVSFKNLSSPFSFFFPLLLAPFFSFCQRLGSLSPSAKGHIKTETLSLHAKESRVNKHGAKTPRRSTSPGRCSGGDKPSHRRHTRSTSKHKRKGRRRAKTSASKESSWSVSHTGYSSDSEGSTYSHQYHATTGAEKNHRVHLKT